MADTRYRPTVDAGGVSIEDGPGAPPRQPIAARQAAAIIEVTRELARSAPPPRGAPYYCLDTDAPYDLRVLDALCARGIFRKYEFALDIGSGFGGRARWLAARFGCRIVGVDPCWATVSAARLLNRRARMDEQVAFQVGQSDRLPLRGRIFTHVWWLQAADDSATPATLAEAFRVLRRGGQFALQREGTAVAGCDTLLALLGQVGFVELVVCDAQMSEPPHSVRLARDRLRLALQHTADVAAALLQTEQPGGASCVQIFARRPA